ncbi:nuclear transport factor 2 family protein [Streptomyces sp. NPDC127044]
MTLATEGRLAIAELVSLHGHLFDDGRLDELTELFTEDVGRPRAGAVQRTGGHGGRPVRIGVVRGRRGAT